MLMIVSHLARVCAEFATKLSLLCSQVIAGLTHISQLWS